LILNKFIKNNLKNFILATKEEIKNEGWHVKGILHKYSNKELKFNVRAMFKMDHHQLGKNVEIKNKSDKVVFETVKEWVIIDTEELQKYLINQKEKIIKFETLLERLEWTIFIPKNNELID
jgi:hypothetical protein